MELTALFTEHSQLLGSICGAVLTLATAVIGRKVVLVHTFGGKRGASAANDRAPHTDSGPQEQSGAEAVPAIQVTIAALIESEESPSAFKFDWEPVASEIRPRSGSGKPEASEGQARFSHEQAVVELWLGKDGIHPSLADAELVVRTVEGNFRRLYNRAQTVRPQMTIAEHNHLFRTALAEIDESPISAAIETRHPRGALSRSYLEELQHVIRAWRVLNAARNRYEAVRAEHLAASVQRSGDLN